MALDGELLGALPLPVGGLMSEEPIEVVREGLNRVLEAVRALGFAPPRSLHGHVLPGPGGHPFAEDHRPGVGRCRSVPARGALGLGNRGYRVTGT